MPGISYDYDDQDKKLDKDDECPIRRSELCYWLAEENCERCYVHGIKDADARKLMLRNWKVMLSNLPENIDDLGNSDTCVLCKGEPNKTECYATFDLAHPDPPAKKGLILGFGKKVRIPVGSMFSVPLACCKECRRKLRMVGWSFAVIFIAMFVLGIVVTYFLGSVEGAPEGSLLLIGLGILAALGIAGFFIGKAVSNVIARKVAKELHYDLREIPLIREMFANGWFVYDNGKTTDEFKLFFKNKKDFKNVFPPENFCVDSKNEE